MVFKKGPKTNKNWYIKNKLIPFESVSSCNTKVRVFYTKRPKYTQDKLKKFKTL